MTTLNREVYRQAKEYVKEHYPNDLTLDTFLAYVDGVYNAMIYEIEMNKKYNNQ